MERSKKIFLAVVASIFAILSVFAEDFTALDQSGKGLSLADFRGEVVVLHITNIEVPLCIACKDSLEAQIAELERLFELDPSINLITINMRKNPSSEDGKTLAERWCGAEIDWIWIEDFEPYSVSGKYVDYWNVDGGFSNPTILLVGM